MGLDMYLSHTEALGGWEASRDKDKARAVLGVMGYSMDDLPFMSKSVEVTIPVAYWRKANAIHGWFVREVAGDVDDQKSIEVAHGQLEDLLDKASTALMLYDAGMKDKAATLLPPMSGFFFGSTELDEWYRHQLESTVEQVEKALKRHPGGYFTYQASW